MAEILPLFPSQDSDVITARDNAVLRAMDASEDNPDDAARAYSLSQTTGAPPAIVQQDQDQFENETKAKLTANLLNGNPFLREYVNSHPLAASISNDDWGNLHDLSDAMKGISQASTKWGALSTGASALEKADQALGPIFSAGWDEAKKQFEDTREGAVYDPFEVTPSARQAHPNFSALVDAIASTPLGSAAQYVAKTVGGPVGLASALGEGAVGFAYGALTKAGVPESLVRDLAGMAEAEMMGVRGHPPEPAGSIVQRIREDSMAREGQAALSLAKPFLDKGEIPPAGLHPFIDSARAIMSKLDGDAVERATKLAQSTNTWSRDKEFQLDHFLSLWPDSHIEVPLEAVQKLYGTKLPESDDGILGWVPNLRDQMESSAITGEKIEIPRSLWITHADPEIRKALKDDAAWRPGAMSTNEADATLKALPQEMREREPEGMRMLRQTAEDATQEGIKQIIEGQRPKNYEEYLTQRTRGMTEQEILDSDNVWAGARELQAKRSDRQGFQVPFTKAYQDIANIALQAHYGRDITPEELSTVATQHAAVRRYWEAPSAVEKSAGEKFVDGLYRIAGLEPPNQMLERLSPTEAAGLDFRNIIPEGSQRRISITTIGGRDPGVEKTLVGTHHFPLSAILPNLHRGQLSPELRVMSEFFGKQLDRLAGDVPVTVVPKEEMDKKYDEHVLGFYSPSLHRIVLRSDIVDGSHPSYFATEVVMHEAEHAISSRELKKFKPLADYLDKLRKYTLNFLNSAGDEGKAFTAKHANAFKDYDEFLVEAKSNMALQDILHRVPLTQELALGLRIPRGTMWDAVRLIAKELWTKISGKVPTENVMDAIFRAAHSLEDIKAKMEAARPKAHILTPEQEDMIEGMQDAPRPELAARKEPPSPEDQELFAAKSLGMSQRVYRAMRDLALKRRDERARFLSEQAQKEEQERLSTEWKGNEDVVRDLVRDHVMHLPDIAADQFLRTGELFGSKYRRTRLDGSLIDTTGLDPEHYNATQGLRPDAIAEALGFQSGDQMLQSLRNLKSIRDTEGLTPAAHIDQMVKALTDREMKERFGTFEQQVLDAAKEHIFGETQYDILHEHTLRLAEQLGLDKAGFTKDDIKAMARLEMNKVRVGRIDSTRAMKEVGDRGRMVEAAEATGDWDTAFKISQQREIMFQIAKLHMSAERAIEKFKRRGKQFSKREPGAVPIEWSNAIQDVFQRAGVAINRTPEDIQREYQNTGNGSLRDFVNAQSLPQIFVPDPDFPVTSQGSLTVASFLLDPTYRAENGWKNMSWEEFEAVHNSIDSLYTHGRKANKIEVQGTTYDREQLISDMVDLFYDVFKSDDPTVNKGVDEKNVMKTLWAGLIQMETLWTRLARGDPNNLFMKMNMDIMSAGNQISALERRFSREYADIGKFPKQMLKSVENSLFFEPNERGGDIADTPMKMTTRNLLAILQNVGNWSNYDKLTRGFGLENAQTREFYRKVGYQQWMNDPVMNWLFKHTTKEDWDRAQALGDLFERIFTMSEDAYYRMGARPGPRIELRPIETPFGTYKGWYHPIIYDSQRPMFWLYDEETGERKPVSKAKIASPMDDAGIYNVATPSGYQKARTGYAAPLLLNFDAIPGRMKQMINDIAMREVVTEVDKIFSDARFKTAMSKTYGPHYTELLKPYLRDISGQRRYVDPLSVTGGRILGYMYENLVSTAIGMNPGTVLKHFPTALVTSVNQVGAGAFWKEFANTWLNPLGWKNVGWVLNKSDEVARRSRNFRESLTGAYEDLFPGGVPAPLSGILGENWGSKLERARQAMIKAGATPVAWSDLASVVPMWNVVYKREMRAGNTEAGAIRLADQAVRYAHGSTATTARSGVMRAPVGRAIAPFYTFFNDMLQRQYETAWRAKDAVGYLKDGNYQKGAKEMGKVATGIWAYVLWPALVEQAISPIVWDQDDDNYLKKGAEIIGRDVSSSWPLVRDFVSFLTSGQDPTLSIYGSGATNVMNFVRDVEKGDVALSPDKAGKTIKHTATMVGTALGVMNAQMGRWGQFAYDYATGKQDPEGPLTAEGLPQWYRALRFGDIKERKR